MTVLMLCKGFLLIGIQRHLATEVANQLAPVAMLYLKT